MALVITERLLIEVSEEMEWLDTYVGTSNRTLQETPEVLHPVRVDVAVYIRLGMVNNIVCVIGIQSVIRKVFVGHHMRVLANVSFDLALQCLFATVRHNGSVDTPGVSLKQPEHNRLP